MHQQHFSQEGSATSSPFTMRNCSGIWACAARAMSSSWGTTEMNLLVQLSKLILLLTSSSTWTRLLSNSSRLFLTKSSWISFSRSSLASAGEMLIFFSLSLPSMSSNRMRMSSTISSSTLLTFLATMAFSSSNFCLAASRPMISSRVMLYLSSDSEAFCGLDLAMRKGSSYLAYTICCFLAISAILSLKMRSEQPSMAASTSGLFLRRWSSWRAATRCWSSSRMPYFLRRRTRGGEWQHPIS